MAIDPEIEARLDWLERAMIVLADSFPGGWSALPPRPGQVDTRGAPAPGFTASTDDHAEQELRALVEAGHTLRAIKLYQATKGVGLKEAKREIERLSEQLRRG